MEHQKTVSSTGKSESPLSDKLDILIPASRLHAETGLLEQSNAKFLEGPAVELRYLRSMHELDYPMHELAPHIRCSPYVPERYGAAWWQRVEASAVPENHELSARETSPLCADEADADPSADELDADSSAADCSTVDLSAADLEEDELEDEMEWMSSDEPFDIYMDSDAEEDADIEEDVDMGVEEDVDMEVQDDAEAEGEDVDTGLAHLLSILRIGRFHPTNPRPSRSDRRQKYRDVEDIDYRLQAILYSTELAHYTAKAQSFES